MGTGCRQKRRGRGYAASDGRISRDGLCTLQGTYWAWLGHASSQAVASPQRRRQAGRVSFINMVEAQAIWPMHARIILFHLIPKASGGRRPIGILPGMVRTWEAMRRETFARWERRYDWACRGKSAKAAVWEQFYLQRNVGWEPRLCC